MQYINPFKFICNNNLTNRNAYSTVPHIMTRGISMITYPYVMHNKYTVNTDGEIYDMHSGVRLPSYPDQNKYHKVNLLTVTNNCMLFHLHRIVAYQFCNPPCDFDKYQVNHITGDKSDNRACNLEWITSAANNQHEVFELGGITPSRPHATAETVHKICQLFQEGKSNTEVMQIMGYINNNANHTFLRDIRNGDTWKGISCNYTFSKSSKKHAYTPEEKDKIAKLFLEGYSIPEIFYEMQGREYCPATDRRESIYRTIQSIQIKLRNKGYRV